jgi:catechol 2,3-dioxygenase-like lactoylglutathione lyase family enzyme
MKYMRLLVFVAFFIPWAEVYAPPRRPEIYGIALVRLQVSNMDASRRFYQNILGLGSVSQDCFIPQHGAPCFELNIGQQVEIAPSRRPQDFKAVETVGFLIRDATEMRQYLLAQGVKCGEVKSGDLAGKFVETSDPENHNVLFLAAVRAGSQLGYPVDHYLIHAGLVVHDRSAEDKFYKDILGFHLYWQGGRTDDETDWVNMQVPDGTDWIEYMLNVPASADRHTLGVMNHIALGVPDIHAAEAQLRKNGWTGTEEPKIGRGGKWQLNLYDPDDTRVELMEFTPVQKPCCSEYTGPHPGPNR